MESSVSENQPAPNPENIKTNTPIEDMPRPRWPSNAIKGGMPDSWNKSLVSESSKPVGRPFKFRDPQEFQKKGDKFFQHCDEKEEPYTFTGLALALGFTGREQFLEYQKRIEFSSVLKGLRARCEAYAEKRLFQGAAAGPIFALKNYGWKDTSETTVTVKPPVLVDSLESIDADFEDITESQKEESPLLTSGDSDDSDSGD